MTPSQLKALIDAADKDQSFGGLMAAVWSRDDAIVAAAPALVALWEAAEGVGPLDENGNSSVHHPDDAKPFNDALRRLEELP